MYNGWKFLKVRSIQIPTTILKVRSGLFDRGKGEEKDYSLSLNEYLEEVFMLMKFLKFHKIVQMNTQEDLV